MLQGCSDIPDCCDAVTRELVEAITSARTKGRTNLCIENTSVCEIIICPMRDCDTRRNRSRIIPNSSNRSWALASPLQPAVIEGELGDCWLNHQYEPSWCYTLAQGACRKKVPHHGIAAIGINLVTRYLQMKQKTRTDSG
jgi:hypothetical protein